MGVHDYHIRKIKEVTEGRVSCPDCGRKTFLLGTETGDYDDWWLNYCPYCELFFEIDDGYFTSEDTQGLEKLQVPIKKYGLKIQLFNSPLYFETSAKRRAFIRKFKGALTYSTFIKEVRLRKP